ncbi:MAG: hypothetical protein M3Q34_03880 [bacterium]|nr:hypothetical protein [bacterium]
MKKTEFTLAGFLFIAFLLNPFIAFTQTPQIERELRDLDTTLQKVMWKNNGVLKYSKFELKEMTITGIPNQFKFMLGMGELAVTYVNELGGGSTLRIQMSEDGHFMRLADVTIDFPNGDKLSILDEDPDERLIQIYIERVQDFLESLL